MLKSTLIKKYAHVLCDILPDQEEFIIKILDLNSQILSFYDFWNNPTISSTMYQQFFEFCEKKCDAPKKWLDFGLLLINNKRMNLMPFILEEYLNICGHTHKAVLLSADPVSTLNKRLIEQWLKHHLKGDVNLITRINPSLLGGFKIQGDDFVYDATLKHSLYTLKKALE